jgi:hypothetical protein
MNRLRDTLQRSIQPAASYTIRLALSPTFFLSPKPTSSLWTIYFWSYLFSRLTWGVDCSFSPSSGLRLPHFLTLCLLLTYSRPCAVKIQGWAMHIMRYGYSLSRISLPMRAPLLSFTMTTVPSLESHKIQTMIKKTTSLSEQSHKVASLTVKGLIPYKKSTRYWLGLKG